MVLSLVSSIVVLAISVLLGWLALRAWRARNPFAKWIGGVLASLLTLIAAAIGILALVGYAKIYAPSTTPAPDMKVAGTPQQVERGRYITNSLCVECHTKDRQLPLSGGADFGKEIPIPVGSIVAANLTPAGPLKDWSDGQIFRALRTGIDANGHHLLLMSNVPVRNLSDEDIQAVIAYLRSQPAVANDTPSTPDRPSVLALAMLGAGLFPGGLAPVDGVVTAPAKAPTAEYGKYIVSYGGCRDCHGQNLTGGQKGGFSPVGPNLRVVKGWTAEQFVTTLRTGVDPTGHNLSDAMPWRVLGRYDDSDLTAIYQYLVSLQ